MIGAFRAVIGDAVLGFVDKVLEFTIVRRGMVRDMAASPASAGIR
jgi:hypothetical protein